MYDVYSEYFIRVAKELNIVVATLRAYLRNIVFGAFLVLYYFQPNTFFGQVQQGCLMKCEILQSPMILYRSLLFIATAMNDSINHHH